MSPPRVVADDRQGQRAPSGRRSPWFAPRSRGMVEDDEGGGEVLSSQEQRIWDDVQPYWAEEAEEPLGPAPSGRQEVPRDESDPPTAVVAGAWITITLVFVGAMTAALT